MKVYNGTYQKGDDNCTNLYFTYFGINLRFEYYSNAVLVSIDWTKSGSMSVF